MAFAGILDIKRGVHSGRCCGSYVDKKVPKISAFPTIRMRIAMTWTVYTLQKARRVVYSSIMPSRWVKGHLIEGV